MTLITGTERNGKQLIDRLIGTTGPDLIFGDVAGDLSAGKGGNDYIDGGGCVDSYPFDILIGDAANLRGTARGGNDHIDGKNGSTALFGDAGFTGFDENDNPIGGVMEGNAVGGKDTLFNTRSAYGDCYEMRENAVGGNDYLSGRANESAFLTGDAYEMLGHSRGGKDVLIAGFGKCELVGDSYSMSGDSDGGNDTLITQGGYIIDEYGYYFGGWLFGDGRVMTERASGGNDRIFASEFGNTIAGDGWRMYSDTKGGNDYLLGGRGNDIIAGDGWYMYDSAKGGDDRLLGGDGIDELAGDGFWLKPGVEGGDDRLSGGTGADLFYCVASFGDDVITDFSGAGGDGDKLLLDIRPEDLDDLVSITRACNGKVVISVGDNTVTLIGNPVFAESDIGYWPNEFLL